MTSITRNATALSLALAALAGSFITSALPARAAGVVRIQQKDGSVREYPQSRMAWNGSTLWLHSADGKGVLQITTAACTYIDNLVRCLPYLVVLHQGGANHKIAIDHGTVYMNFTSDPEQMPYSSQKLGANGLLVTIETQHGTYVTARGSLDEVKQ
ncbi:MAG TPA: hypothetical protein VMA98_07155 [Candidatus Acidoferrales bacterium]|nr:hypothetical protein [Candidatus Acidoferrales bacterium]